MRAPIWLYRLGLGWLLGTRFLLLGHTGRKSGKPRQVVLEVVKYEPASGRAYVASGFGRKSDWYLNVKANPQVEVQVWNHRFQARAEELSEADSESLLLEYGSAHPGALRMLNSLLGYDLQPGEQGIRELAHRLPLIALILESGSR